MLYEVSGLRSIMLGVSDTVFKESETPRIELRSPETSQSRCTEAIVSNKFLPRIQ